MTAIIFDEAEEDLERAFNHYEALRGAGLGHEMVDEFRRGLERVLTHPKAWQRLDDTYRRYRLHCFPYGIVYRIDEVVQQIVIVEFMHLSQKPGGWKLRDQ